MGFREVSRVRHPRDQVAHGQHQAKVQRRGVRRRVHPGVAPTLSPSGDRLRDGMTCLVPQIRSVSPTGITLRIAFKCNWFVSVQIFLIDASQAHQQLGEEGILWLLGRLRI